MALSAMHLQTEITGPVVPVDNDRDFVADAVPVVPVPPPPSKSPGPSDGGSGLAKHTPHKIVSGEGDEHRIITAHLMQAQAQRQQYYAKRNPPKFSSVLNEYMGACLEDHCTIGKSKFSFLSSALAGGLRRRFRQLKEGKQIG